MLRLTFRTSSKVKRSKVKVIRPLIAETENQPYLWNGKACTSPLAGARAAALQAAQLVNLAF